MREILERAHVERDGVSHTGESIFESEINEFNQKESFDKTKAITRWERDNTLDC